MSGHTPGPWVARPAPYGWDIFSHELGVWIGNTATPLGKNSPFYPPIEQSTANAALMAQAPELWDEVRELRRALADAVTVFGISDETQFHLAYAALIVRAQAASP